MKNLLSVGAVLAGLSCATAFAQDTAETAHVAVENPADLSQQQANAIYDALKERMDALYAPADLDLIKGYQTWKRYNSAPYISATHGQRFVNNFVNEIGKDYGKLKSGERYPVGTVLAKDSITVTDDSKRFPGAMFVMEKLPEGRSPATADWRYVMVIPDGSVFGDTIGDEPELVEYCHVCHEAVADDDYVFYIPEEYRLD